MIENLKERIQEEARYQIINCGYGKTTIRSVAKACNIGVGTMYNYFRSKDELISSFMLDDWHKCVGKMEGAASDDIEAFLRTIQEALAEFILKYKNLFADEDAIKAFSSVFSKRHTQLRGNIAKIIIRGLEKTEFEDRQFLAEHLAESIINWSMEGVPFDKQFSIIQKLI